MVAGREREERERGGEGKRERGREGERERGRDSEVEGSEVEQGEVEEGIERERERDPNRNNIVLVAGEIAVAQRYFIL